MNASRSKHVIGIEILGAIAGVISMLFALLLLFVTGFESRYGGWIALIFCSAAGAIIAALITTGEPRASRYVYAVLGALPFLTFLDSNKLFALGHVVTALLVFEATVRIARRSKRLFVLLGLVLLGIGWNVSQIIRDNAIISGVEGRFVEQDFASIQEHFSYLHPSFSSIAWSANATAGKNRVGNSEFSPGRIEGYKALRTGTIEDWGFFARCYYDSRGEPTRWEMEFRKMTASSTDDHGPWPKEGFPANALEDMGFSPDFVEQLRGDGSPYRREYGQGDTLLLSSYVSSTRDGVGTISMFGLIFRHELK